MFDWLRRADPPEVRNYSDAIIEQILARAGASTAPASSGTAAAIAAGWIGRTLSQVQLIQQPGARAFRSVDLASVGRDLVLEGQSLWLNDPSGWLQCLPRPAAITLSTDSRDWIYSVEIAGVGSRMSVGSRVAHFRWQTDARDPSRGLSPIDTPAGRFLRPARANPRGRKFERPRVHSGTAGECRRRLRKAEISSSGFEGKNADDRKFFRIQRPFTRAPGSKIGAFSAGQIRF